jgi:hypothetical protein
VRRGGETEAARGPDQGAALGFGWNRMGTANGFAWTKLTVAVGGGECGVETASIHGVGAQPWLILALLIGPCKRCVLDGA